MADSQRKTANLFNVIWESGSLGASGGAIADTNAIRTKSPISCEAEKTYTFVPDIDGYDSIWVNYYGTTNSRERIDTSGGTFTTPQDCEQVRFRVTKTNIGVEPVQQYNAMLNEGQTALPYEPYGWVHSLRKLTTATEAVENPLYSDGTAITAYTIKGNTVQNGTPTPSAPVDVVGVGTLDSGQYKIPISSGQQTTDINIGTEQLNKVDTYTDMLSSNTLTKNTITYTYKGDSSENWRLQSINSYGIANFYITMETPYQNIDSICSHLERQRTTIANTQTEGYFLSDNTPFNTFVRINRATVDTVEKLKQWLAAQYANGTPLTFVLALKTPTTTQITMPSIPTTDGANSISVDTTVQPSEFTATWTGWHDASVKEWDGSDWQ